ncbi:hypothetical protein VTN00DRAFT_6831 [Thermoascus crustaceus]|uniref:uncharacterized protein n=1 Tax=Thermoascus crustaceus TaxID=5088 RepID=UPI003743DCD8
MSFGFSVGDFLAVANLIRGIVSSLRTDSTASYNALIEAAVNGVKIAALVCQHPLDEFAGKLKKVQSLGIGKGGKLGRREMLVMWGRKVQWGFTMEEEVMKLRAYLAAHVGSLNMRLITYGLLSRIRDSGDSRLWWHRFRDIIPSLTV